MNDIAAILTAGAGTLGVIGGGIRFAWNKIENRFVEQKKEFEARFQAVEARCLAAEAELIHCREREAASVERRGTQLTVIELLWQEVQRHNPGSVVLTRVKSLLDDLKKKEREDT